MPTSKLSIALKKQQGDSLGFEEWNGVQGMMERLKVGGNDLVQVRPGVGRQSRESTIW